MRIVVQIFFPLAIACAALWAGPALALDTFPCDSGRSLHEVVENEGVAFILRGQCKGEWDVDLDCDGWNGPCDQVTIRAVESGGSTCETKFLVKTSAAIPLEELLRQKVECRAADVSATVEIQLVNPAAKVP